MQPFDFLASLQRHEEAKANQPDPEQEFTKAQFQSLVVAMAQTHKEMVSFLKNYHPKAEITNLPDSIKTPDVATVVSAVKGLEKSLKPFKQDNNDVIAAIKGLQLSPTYKPEINVAPTPITVAAPKVDVKAPDLSPITKAIQANKPETVDLKPLIAAVKDVSQQVIRKPTPVANTPTDPLIQYAEADIDDVDATNALKVIRYYGYTNTSGAWYIRRLDATNIGTTGKSVRMVQGAGNYATGWTNRATLTYTVWGT